MTQKLFTNVDTTKPKKNNNRPTNSVEVFGYIVLVNNDNDNATL